MNITQDQASASADLNLAIGKLASGKGGKAAPAKSAKDGDVATGDEAKRRNWTFEDYLDAFIRRYALQEYSETHSTEEVKREIMKSAKARGENIPDEWLHQEQPKELLTTLTLEAVAKPQILLEAEANNGVMRVKVPFYVGNSTTNAPGFRKKIYFPEKILPSIVQEGKSQIDQGKQPITVYARHNHATAGNHLPVGSVADLEQEGRIGYAVIDVAPTAPDGQNVQTLARLGMLNAVSLRSRRFRLEERTVNQESMLECEGLALDGIDFAPDNPAQDTYGIEILNQEALVEPAVQNNPPKRSQKLSDEITLEDVPSTVREQIEGPLRQEMTTLRQEVDGLKAERNRAELESHIRSMSALFPDPEKGLKLLQDLAQEKGAKSKAELDPHLTPILLEVMAALKSETATTPKPTIEQQLREMFASESGGKGSTEKPETLNQEDAVPEHRATIGGLAVPE